MKYPNETFWRFISIVTLCSILVFFSAHFNQKPSPTTGSEVANQLDAAQKAYELYTQETDPVLKEALRENIKYIVRGIHPLNYSQEIRDIIDESEY